VGTIQKEARHGIDWPIRIVTDCHSEAYAIGQRIHESLQQEDGFFIPLRFIQNDNAHFSVYLQCFVPVWILCA
jgi:hypothetical protein